MEASDASAWRRIAATVSMPELIRNATGKPLSAAAWVRYIEAKYLEE